ncbi:undecaprenyldiphospho-muramoylpentapeptide beta-N-acetylglucosaminyltransferase [Leekyejoonella antrihumi]|uniref:UDP-N-acetylglucosamine--N-acetylmuramyl-(pentapeptide) pyrophosphoryl-undecaprenol N-acetylglucosamine transferase n=1 Tax=Leekyejoonella antrihumi TaxID=1660198 RepID=A0A563DZW8_9MICO|nr:undecaprenyldiphospho-muramoylpentapeptide beta-N-acetylglucosaminyltransferase [Leekyejoonella antrihumi]TWP35184.1 undecaprenyldiphospho-muramoylpentapeptide beta-N-acetylglucosaminyltransferase [Leekyejoonella antrihumi]
MSLTSRHPRSILLAGGGTTGHIAPLLATADALRDQDGAVRITVLGTRGGLEETLVPARGYDLRLIPKVAFPRRPNAAAARFPAALVAAISQTGHLIDDVRADVVVGFGGYVSPPAYLAARRRHLPIVVHEGNARAGLASRLGARFTTHVATTFDATKLAHAQVVGLPLRTEITTMDRAALRVEALSRLGLADGYPTVLVTGGSSGAQRINDAFAQSVSAVRAAGVQVLHITGRGKEFDPGTSATGEAPYVVRPYAERMELCYAVADLVVTRAGAGMVCETAAIGLPAVFVPLPIGNGEQRLNAEGVVRVGGALMVDNADFTAQWVQREIIPLALDRARLQRMCDATRGLGHQDADKALVAMIDRAAELSPARNPSR